MNPEALKNEADALATNIEAVKTAFSTFGGGGQGPGFAAGEAIILSTPDRTDVAEEKFT